MYGNAIGIISVTPSVFAGMTIAEYNVAMKAALVRAGLSSGQERAPMSKKEYEQLMRDYGGNSRSIESGSKR